MEKRVELEKRGKSPSQIKELVLDNCHSTTIAGLTDEFCNLESLSLIRVGLTSLKGFPKLPNLQKLELSDNRISGGLNVLSSSSKLSSLNLSGNKIANIEALEPLKALKNLETLDLVSCSVANLDEYREKVFSMLPSLKYLDGFDKEEKEADGTDEENDKVIDGESDLDEEDEEGELDEEEDDDEDGEVEEEEEEEEDDVGLSYLEKNIDEESEGDDYNPDGRADVEDEEDEEDDDEEEEEEKTPRGQKRKLDDSQD